jgi:hypothetical protein
VRPIVEKPGAHQEAEIEENRSPRVRPILEKPGAREEAEIRNIDI